MSDAVLDSDSAEISVPLLQSRNHDLLVLLEVSRQLVATQDLGSLLSTIETSALRVLNCERASIFFHDSQTQELYSQIATGEQTIRFKDSQGIAGTVFHDGVAVNIPDVQADPRFNKQIDRKTGFQTRTMLTCPLKGLSGTTIGVLQFLNKRNGIFDDWDETLAQTLSAQAGVAVQRQRLIADVVQKERYENDLAIARSIQQGLIPARSPLCGGFDVAGWNRPAEETGGDFFDFQSLPTNTLAITLADVTGHGIGPALLATGCRALVRASWMFEVEEPGHLARTINQLLAEDLPQDRFITAFFGLLDPAKRLLRYCSAGQGPLLHYCADSRLISELPVQGIPLGIAAEFEYSSAPDLILSPGDWILVLSDGFFEWPNDVGEAFGTTRLKESFHRHRSLSAANLIQAICQDVLEFSKGVPQADDLTAIAVKML